MHNYVDSRGSRLIIWQDTWLTWCVKRLFLAQRSESSTLSDMTCRMWGYGRVGGGKRPCHKNPCVPRYTVDYRNCWMNSSVNSSVLDRNENPWPSCVDSCNKPLTWSPDLDITSLWSPYHSGYSMTQTLTWPYPFQKVSKLPIGYGINKGAAPWMPQNSPGLSSNTDPPWGLCWSLTLDLALLSSVYTLSYITMSSMSMYMFK